MQRVPATRRSRATAALFIIAVALAPNAVAVSTSFWRTDSFATAEDGNVDGTSILHDGRVVLSSEFERIDTDGAQYVWAGEGVGGGDVVVVAGTPGRVLLLGGGDAVELLSMETSDFTAMAVSNSGDIFVGTAPGGEVYLVTSDGESRLFFETGEGYIWSMVYSEEHGLLVGTGDEAKVYAVDGNGSGTVIYESNDSSVSALASVGGRVLAGTSIDGMLLDITPGSDLRVLSDTSFDEISGVARGADGAVYFAATTVSLEDVLDESNGFGSSFGDGAVFRLTPTGSAIELWRSADAPITSLGLSPDGSVLAGIGSGGLIYSIRPDGGADLVSRLDGEEILSIRGTDDIIVTLGAPGGVYRMGDGLAESGEYESEVLDARSNATWGELSWSADVPAGADIELLARSGNTADPDETWNEWERVPGDGGGQVACPQARFLQWKARLIRGSRGAGPELLSVEVAYLRENLPPLISAVTVHEPGDVVQGAAGGMDSSPMTQTLPGGVEVTYSRNSGAPPDRELSVLLRGVRTASWDALDPNGDALTFDVFLKSDDEGDWKLLDEDVFGRTLHTWDTQAMTDGIYRLKVTATDRRSNSLESALTASAVSQPFIVDHTPPEFSRVEVESAGSGLEVTGLVEDSASQVMFVDVSVDYGPWVPAFAEDGMFDSKGESFRLVVNELDGGEHAVSVRAADRSGNPAVVRLLSK
ncbi:MAG TPA: WD40 repeat domain-containing protein [bacterium]|nr:WD40 repeat domain-containing protein [bacterium]